MHYVPGISQSKMHYVPGISRNFARNFATEMTISCWLVLWIKMRIVLSQATHIYWI